MTTIATDDPVRVRTTSGVAPAAGIVTGGGWSPSASRRRSFAVTDIATRRFSWSEFLLQAWFMTRVSLLPTILVAIPFGVITSVQIGAVANQIGATSFRAPSTASACSARARRWSRR